MGGEGRAQYVLGLLCEEGEERQGSGGGIWNTWSCPLASDDAIDLNIWQLSQNHPWMGVEVHMGPCRTVTLVSVQ